MDRLCFKSTYPPHRYIGSYLTSPRIGRVADQKDIENLQSSNLLGLEGVVDQEVKGVETAGSGPY